MTRRCGGSALVLGLCLLAGCRSGDAPIPITGTVSFGGKPVGEGMVQFVDEKTGRGAEVPLGPDGKYTAELHQGTYNVLVSPPYIEVMNGGMPDMRYKKVDNIPKKYHSTATSGFTAQVSTDRTTHDFDLRP